MNGHPGGSRQTLLMLDRAGLKPQASILDLGAGTGETVLLLRQLGFQARGIDLKPRRREPENKSGSGREAESGLLREDLTEPVGAADRSTNAAELLKTDLVEPGNLLQTGYRSASWDAVISQCSFFVSGNEGAALAEACRLLKPGGVLMYADVGFNGQAAFEQVVQETGFNLIYSQDWTKIWQEYYLECIWRGLEECQVQRPPGKKCGYYGLVAVKEEGKQRLTGLGLLSLPAG